MVSAAAQTNRLFILLSALICVICGRLNPPAQRTRTDGRAADQIRPVSFELGIAPNASGSVLVSMGNTRVICGVMIEEAVPRWMKEPGAAGRPAAG